LAEITNLFMLSTRTTVEYCIMYFVAFHVLTAIDNIYAEGVCDFALLHAVKEPLKFKTLPRDVMWSTRTWKNKIMYVGLRIVQFLYNCGYYYYLPFIVNFIPYFFAGDPAEHKKPAH